MRHTNVQGKAIGHRFILLLVVSILCLSSVMAVDYDTKISQINNDDYVSINTPRSAGQSFTPTSNYSITRVAIIGDTTPVTISIREFVGGTIASYDLANATSVASGSYQNATFTTPVNVNSSSMYAIVVRKYLADSRWYIRTGADEYAGGQYYQANDGITYVSVGAGFDGTFIIYGQNTTSVVTGNEQVTLNYPTNGLSLSTIGANFTATFNISGASNYSWKNATYYLWLSNGTLFNQTFVILTGNNTDSTKYIDDFTLGNYKWNVLGCFNNSWFSNCTYATSNYTFIVGATVVNQSYSATTYETSSNTFILNFSRGNFINTDVKLNYNNTNYSAVVSCSGSLCSAINNIDIPLTNGTTNIRSFYWIITTYTPTTYSHTFSSTFTQTVNPILLYTCASGNVTANFTAYNEVNLTSIIQFNFLGTFDYWLGSGGLYKTLNVNNLTVDYAKICSRDSTQNYKTNAITQYEKSGYIKRNYYLVNQTLNSSIQEIKLILLGSGDGTSFIINVKEANQIPVADAYLYIQRYYPGTGTFETVAMQKTNTDGQTVSSFEAETEDYRILVYKDGRILYTSPIQKIFCQTTPCTINIQVEGEGVPTWNPIGNLHDLNWTLDFNYTTNIYTFFYADASGTTSYGRMWVYQDRSGNKLTICDTNSTNNAAQLTCDVTGYTGTITAEVFISRSPETFVYLKSVIINSVKAIFGFEGLFWAMIIIMTLAVAGILVAGPSGAVLGCVLGVILIPLIGIASFGVVLIWGVIVLGVVLIWLLNQ